MNPAPFALSPSLIAALLAVIAVLAAIRALWSRRTFADSWARRLPRLLSPCLLAALLWPVLVPPPVARPAQVLVIATADAPASLQAGDGERLLALPEAPALGTAEPVPDLATALRRHPDARALRVVGNGLPPRDRDAARGLPLQFEATPLPAGLVELQATRRITAGRRWRVSGRFEGEAGTVELADPGGRVVAETTADSEGRFVLETGAGPPGRGSWQLRGRPADGDAALLAQLPLAVENGAPLRLRLLSGGIDPESKYLRRWALDSGLALNRQASLGGGVEIGDSSGAPGADQLAETDLLVLDERRWRALGTAGRARLRAAVRDGLGLLLRLTDDPGPNDRAELREWGFEVEAAPLSRETTLPGSSADDPRLTRRPLRLGARDGVPLQRAADGEVLALWRAEGRGRVALWNLGASFRLQLAGQADRHGELWANAVSTLARARGGAAPALPEQARVGERAVFCGFADGAVIETPGGDAVPLLADPQAGGCAGFWPRHAGWHQLRDGEVASSFVVHAADELPGLATAADREATQALAATAPAEYAPPAAQAPGPRWPWLLAWLALAALLWWLERPAAARAAD